VLIVAFASSAWVNEHLILFERGGCDLKHT
jgi:hypothetical protein